MYANPAHSIFGKDSMQGNDVRLSELKSVAITRRGLKTRDNHATTKVLLGTLNLTKEALKYLHPIYMPNYSKPDWMPIQCVLREMASQS